jgi:UDP-N-acetylglucosamine 1-carboxyvinyltransferase
MKNGAEIVDAGGCKLGNRPVDTLFKGLIDLGVVFNQGDKYVFDGSNMKANDKLWQLEASVTGTENLVLAAALLKGNTVIYNAACEPHVQDLCNYLVKCGALIKGIGTNKIEIEGVENIKERLK